MGYKIDLNNGLCRSSPQPEETNLLMLAFVHHSWYSSYFYQAVGGIKVKLQMILKCNNNKIKRNKKVQISLQKITW